MSVRRSWWWKSRDPVTQHVKVHVPRMPVTTYTEQEVQQILEAAEPPVRDQFRFMYLTGFRSEEVCSLQWSAIDMHRRVINIHNRKENRNEQFPIDDELEGFIRALPMAYSPWVFKYRSIWRVAHKMREILSRLQEKGVIKPGKKNVHTLRKTFISGLIRSGASEAEVMYLARHKSFATTLRYYTEFDQGKMRKALAHSRRRPKSIKKPA